MEAWRPKKDSDLVKWWCFKNEINRTNKHKFLYTRFMKLRVLINKCGIWFTPHALKRIDERWWISMYHLMQDIQKHKDKLYFIRSHERFYLKTERFKYVFSRDYEVLTVSPLKYKICIYKEENSSLENYMKHLLLM